jgi:tetratricopeptide (TPR) repeat protein
MMRRWSVAVLAYALLTTAGSAQSFQQIINHCADRTREPDRRIEACQQLYGAQGLEPAEYALAEMNLGAAYETKGDKAKALAAYSEAITREPNQWQAYFDRLMLRGAMDDLDGAWDDYSQLTKIDPSKLRMDFPSIEYGTQHDSARERGGEHETDEYKQSVAEAQNALTGAFVARCAQKHDRNPASDDALADCNRAISLTPNSCRALGLRGLLEFERGQDQKAIADLDAALAAQADFAPGLYLRGLAKRRSGDVKGGDTDIKAAVTLQPDVTKMFAPRPAQGR